MHDQRTSPGLAQQLTDTFWDHMRRRIRSSPCHTLRASSIGNECDRFLYYEQTDNHLRALHPASLQAIFDLGNHLEKHTIRLLEEMGLEVIEQQRDFFDARYNISGHIDCKLRVPGYEKPLLAEIKGLAPHSCDSINRIEDIRDHKAAHIRRYYSQLQIYLLLDGAELGLFVLLNKVTGALKFIECPLDYAFAETVLKKAERVKAAVGNKTPPSRNLEGGCHECAFAHLCCPDLAYGAAPEVIDDTELEAMLLKREQLKDAASQFKALDEEIKAKVGERPLALCGDYSIAGKKVERKAYSVAAGSYWQASIKRVVKALNGASNGSV